MIIADVSAVYAPDPPAGLPPLSFEWPGALLTSQSTQPQASTTASVPLPARNGWQRTAAQVDDEATPVCILCMDAPVSYKLIPCQHAMFCRTCVYDLIGLDESCPLCRSLIWDGMRLQAPEPALPQ